MTGNSRDYYDLPIRVHWRGWESDTYRLRRQGWQIFAHEGMSRYSFEYAITIALTNPDKSLLIRGDFELPGGQYRMGGMNSVEAFRMLIVDMKEYRPLDRVVITREINQTQWNSTDAALPIDGLARIALEPMREIGELKLFKYTDRPKDIYISQASVDQCLNQILQVQYPTFKEQEGQRVVRPVMEARVYSLAA